MADGMKIGRKKSGWAGIMARSAVFRLFGRRIFRGLALATQPDVDDRAETQEQAEGHRSNADYFVHQHTLESLTIGRGNVTQKFCPQTPMRQGTPLLSR